MNKIAISKANDLVLSEAIAGKISHELNKKKNAAQDLIDSLDTKIKFR